MLSVWIIMSAVSRDECFSAQGDLERVRVFGEFSAINRVKPIDSNRYGFILGKIITFDDTVDNVLQWVFSHVFFPLRCANLTQKQDVRVISVLCTNFAEIA